MLDLKSTAGGDSKQNMWDYFIEVNVIAVGWNKQNPRLFKTKDQLNKVIKNRHAAKTIWDFALNIHPNDIVLIIKGYLSSQKSPVNVFGVSTGGFYRYEKNSKWWWYKRKTKVTSLNIKVKPSVFVKAFNKNALLQTLHGPFKLEYFNKFCRAVGIEYRFCENKINITKYPLKKYEINLVNTTKKIILEEGSPVKITSKAYERNLKARLECIDHYGTKCRICGFSFEDRYGAIGHNIIQVHHKIPLSKIGKKHNVCPIEDLIPVCANCHMIIHKNKRPVSIEKMKKLSGYGALNAPALNSNSTENCS